MDRTARKNYIKNTLAPEESGVLYSFAVVSVLLCSIIFSMIITSISGNDNNSDVVIILNFLLGPIAIALAIGVLRLKKKSALLTSLPFDRVSVVSVMSTVLIGLGLMFGLSELNNLFVTALQKIGLTVSSPTLPSKSVGGVIASVIFVCVLPAVFEEVLFRGLILSGLQKTGTVFAVILSGVLFSIFHMNPAQTIFQFIVGGVYALVIIYGKNILLTVSMHFVNNLYIVLNYYFWDINLVGGAKIAVTIIGVIALVVGVFLLIYKGEKPSEEKEIKDNRAKFILGGVIGIIASLVTWISVLVA